MLPLNQDSYLLATVTFNAPIAPSGLGTLDSEGMAELALTLPPVAAPNLAGWTAHHAFLVIDPAGPLLVTASNAVSLDCLP